MAPTFTGIHHLKVPVSDLTAATTWFERVLLAERIRKFDHVDREGRLFAVILMLPGVEVPVELRRAPAAAEALAGYDPITLSVADESALDDWVVHLDKAGVAHSPKITGFIGQLLEFRTPDGLAIRLYTQPSGGFEAAELDNEQADIDNPWLKADLMNNKEVH